MERKENRDSESGCEGVAGRIVQSDDYHALKKALLELTKEERNRKVKEDSTVTRVPTEYDECGGVAQMKDTWALDDMDTQMSLTENLRKGDVELNEKWHLDSKMKEVPKDIMVEEIREELIPIDSWDDQLTRWCDQLVCNISLRNSVLENNEEKHEKYDNHVIEANSGLETNANNSSDIDQQDDIGVLLRYCLSRINNTQSQENQKKLLEIVIVPHILQKFEDNNKKQRSVGSNEHNSTSVEALQNIFTNYLTEYSNNSSKNSNEKGSQKLKQNSECEIQDSGAENASSVTMLNKYFKCFNDGFEAQQQLKRLEKNIQNAVQQHSIARADKCIRKMLAQLKNPDHCMSEVTNPSQDVSAETGVDFELNPQTTCEESSSRETTSQREKYQQKRIFVVESLQQLAFRNLKHVNLRRFLTHETENPIKQGQNRNVDIVFENLNHAITFLTRRIDAEHSNDENDCEKLISKTCSKSEEQLVTKINILPPCTNDNELTCTTLQEEQNQTHFILADNFDQKPSLVREQDTLENLNRKKLSAAYDLQNRNDDSVRRIENGLKQALQLLIFEKLGQIQQGWNKKSQNISSNFASHDSKQCAVNDLKNIADEFTYSQHNLVSQEEDNLNNGFIDRTITPYYSGKALPSTSNGIIGRSALGEQMLQKETKTILQAGGVISEQLSPENSLEKYLHTSLAENQNRLDQENQSTCDNDKVIDTDSLDNSFLLTETPLDDAEETILEAPEEFRSPDANPTVNYSPKSSDHDNNTKSIPTEAVDTSRRPPPPTPNVSVGVTTPTPTSSSSEIPTMVHSEEVHSMALLATLQGLKVTMAEECTGSIDDVGVGVERQSRAPGCSREADADQERTLAPEQKTDGCCCSAKGSSCDKCDSSGVVENKRSSPLRWAFRNGRLVFVEEEEEATDGESEEKKVQGNDEIIHSRELNRRITGSVVNGRRETRNFKAVLYIECNT